MCKTAMEKQWSHCMWVTGVHTMRHYCRHTADSSNRAGFDLTPEPIHDHMIIKAYHQCISSLPPQNLHTSFLPNLTNALLFPAQKLAVIYPYTHRDLSQVLDRSIVLVVGVCIVKVLKDLISRHVGLIQSHIIVRPQTRQSWKSMWCAHGKYVFFLLVSENIGP